MRFRSHVALLAVLVCACTPVTPSKPDTVHVPDTVHAPVGVDSAARATLDSLHHVLDSLVVALDGRPAFVHDTVWQTKTVTLVDSTALRAAWAHIAQDSIGIAQLYATNQAFGNQVNDLRAQIASLQAQPRGVDTVTVAAKPDTVLVASHTDTLRIACDSVVNLFSSVSQLPNGWPMRVRGDSVYVHASALAASTAANVPYRVCLKQVYTFATVDDSLPLPAARVPVVAPLIPAGYTDSEGRTVPATVSLSTHRTH